MLVITTKKFDISLTESEMTALIDSLQFAINSGKWTDTIQTEEMLNVLQQHYYK